MLLGTLLCTVGAAEPPAEVSGAQVGPAADVADRWPRRFKGQVSPSDPHFDLEILYAEKRFREGLELANERLEANPEDVDLHWMKVRFMYEIGERFSENTKVDKVAYYKQMVAVAERGMKLDPGNMHLHFARGVAMGRLGTTRASCRACSWPRT